MINRTFKKIKSGIDEIFSKAIDGTDPRYRSNQWYIQWGIVKEDIHACVGRILQKGPIPARPKDKELLPEVSEVLSAWRVLQEAYELAEDVICGLDHPLALDQTVAGDGYSVRIVLKKND